MAEITLGAKVGLFIAVIGVLSDLAANLPVEGTVDELEEGVTRLGFDAEELLRNTPLIEALQQVCKAFAEFKITDEVRKELLEYNAAFGQSTL